MLASVGELCLKKSGGRSRSLGLGLVDKIYMGSTWEVHVQVYYGTYLLSIPSIPLSSNCIVVKPRGQGLRMRTSI